MVAKAIVSSKMPKHPSKIFQKAAGQPKDNFSTLGNSKGEMRIEGLDRGENDRTLIDPLLLSYICKNQPHMFNDLAIVPALENLLKPIDRWPIGGRGGNVRSVIRVSCDMSSDMLRFGVSDFWKDVTVDGAMIGVTRFAICSVVDRPNMVKSQVPQCLSASVLQVQPYPSESTPHVVSHAYHMHMERIIRIIDDEDSEQATGNHPVTLMQFRLL
ncbi:hypothetical protein E6O75_ATG10258 [Venturia nashicola]|uniref:Uncharacterized protein n=1 Tax=Venturia nashicola TaxID=86259 RepID=A0A4Z1NFG6_9PEZI|nr:hypothetical protein E6O75_ATG10258 [Venturia nashicola]